MKGNWAILLLVLMVWTAIVAVYAVNSQAPKVMLVVTPTSGMVPVQVFASDISGDQTITAWRYDFGDGTNSTEQKASHTYKSAGTFNLTLTVTNSKGERATDYVWVYAKVKDARINETTSTTQARAGNNTITDAMANKTPPQKAVILTTETSKVLVSEKFPLTTNDADSKTIIKITSYSCDSKKFHIDGTMCGYWIQATRGGLEVATNSPILISPPPYEVLVSEDYNATANQIVQTMKEDPEGAALQTLAMYVDMCPLGRAVTGTPA